jgi:penicillin-binding protein 1C
LGEDQVTMSFIYPKTNNSIFLPKDFDGETNDLILKIAHSKPESIVYWYLDETYVGTTKDIHGLAIIPKTGEHVITVIDEFGNEAKRKISISE